MPARDAANLVPFAVPQFPDDGAVIQRVGKSRRVGIGDRRFGACPLHRRLLKTADSVCLLLDHLKAIEVTAP
jgi:hypothetical protein